MKIILAIVVIAIVADYTPIVSAGLTIGGPISENAGSGSVAGIGVGIGVGGDAGNDGRGGSGAGAAIGGGLRPPATPLFW